MSQDRPKHPFPESVLDARSFGAINNPRKPWTADAPEPDQWQSVFYTLFRGAGAALYLARGERLSAYGWTPQDLLNACLQPHWMIDRMESRASHALSPDGAEAWTALIREITIYHNIAVQTAHNKRLQLIDVLSRNGWNHREIGDHLGLTKQRVQKLLKEFARIGDLL